MNNYAVARVFSNIADLMEIRGDNVFKIKAYRNAAQTMRELTESLAVLAERGALQTIPGVGEAIADKTREILATGTCRFYEQLKEEVPESLTTMLDLPGFGARKIYTVWNTLGVRSLDELEEAIAQHRLRDLSGFGARTEEKLGEAIAAHRRRRERTPLWVALPYAEALLRMLAGTGRFDRLEIAGSVRRMKDTVGDIDLVATAPDPAAAVEALITHPETSEVVARGEGHASVCSHTGLRVDLHVGRPGTLGSLLQRHTGAAAHVEQLRSRGGAGEPDAGAAGDDEHEAYRLIGVPWIPPELREGTGEIEAALAGRLPRLIEAADIRGVLHAHSTWSDGLVGIDRMAAAAREAGYEFHANTDHSAALAITRGLDAARLRQQMAEIDALNAASPDGFRILKGIECDILPDGSLDLPVELLDELDIVIASIHTHQRQDEATMTARILRALESGVVDLLAHPTGRILGHRDPYAVDMERVMETAAARQVALEINAAADRLDLNEVHARRARELGILISINTDAHRPENLAQCRYGIAQARRAWLEPGDVLNAWPLDRLEAWLRRRER